MNFSLHHHLAQSLPSSSQFRTLDVSLDLTSVPFPDKFNFHREVGETFYSELSWNVMTISKDEMRLEKAAKKLKKETVNSRALHLQNESFKELILKLGVNP